MSNAPANTELEHERRGGLNFRTVWLGLAALFVLAGVAAVFGYFAFLRYERVASSHVPSDTTAAVRVDLERILLFEPVRAHGLPLLELGRPTTALGSRLDRFRELSGIKFTMEVREVIWAGGPAAGDWLLLVGGKFPPSTVVPAVRRILAEERSPWRDVDTHLEAPAGIALGQAADGTIILASSRARLERALPSSQAFAELGLTNDGAGSFFARGAVPQELRSLAQLGLIPGASSLARFTSARGKLDTSLALDAELAFEPGTSMEDARSAIERVAGSRVVLEQLFGPLAPKILNDFRLTVSGPAQLRAKLTWDKDVLDALASAAAKLARASAAAP